MIEIIGLLVISWLLIWIYEKGNLSVLGLMPSKEKLRMSGILFIVTGICCSIAFLLRWYFGEEVFSMNPDIGSSFILSGLWVNFKSVLFEELLCRGVGLYILIRMIGTRWAIIISAVVFGMLHWMNGGVWGNPKQMAIVFAWTFAFGLVFAYAYTKYFSIYLPFAMHFGWNIVQNFLLPLGETGNTVIISKDQPEITVSYIVFFSILFLNKIAAIVIDYYILRRVKVSQVNIKGKLT